MPQNLVPFVDEEKWDVLRLAGTLDEKRKHIFLRVLAETANLKLAATAAGFKTTGAINRLRKDDPQFDEAVLAASEAAADMIESEAVRRAMQGVKKGVYYKGERVDDEIVYSDSLLQTLLKAAKPEKYAERSQKNVDINAKIGVAVIPAVMQSPSDWERQSQIVHDQQKLLTEPDQPEVIDVTPTTVRRA